MDYGAGLRRTGEKKVHKLLSVLLLGVLVFNMGIMPVLADAETEGNSAAYGLCEHHAGHDADLCGYVEAVEQKSCTHVHDGECYVYTDVVAERPATGGDAEEEGKVLDCSHIHDEGCGYVKAVAGAPCLFVCGVCRPTDGGTVEEENAGLRDRLNNQTGARRRSIKLPKIKQKSLNSIAYNSANAVEQSISGDYLLIVNNSDDAIETGDLSGLSALVPESRTKRPQQPKGLHRIDYQVPSTIGQNYNMKSVEALETGNYEIGDLYIFLIEDKVDSGYLYPFVAEAKAVGEHAVVWAHAGLSEDETLNGSWAPFYDFKSQETNTLSYEQAEEIAAEFDLNYSAMTDSFGDFLNMDQSGKVSLVCYDIQDGYKPNGDGGYIGGFFAGYDFLLDGEGYPIYNGMQMLHIDTYPAMSTDGRENDLGNIPRAYSTLFHEFQHMINFSIGYQYGHLNTSDGSYYNSQDTFINEMLSMSAEQILGYAQDDRIKYYNDFNPATGFSLTQWDEDLMNYSLSYLLSQYLWSQKGSDDVFYNITNSGYHGAEAIETAFEQQYNEGDSQLIDMTFEGMHTSYRSALALNEESGLNSFTGSYVEGKELKQHLYTESEPVSIPPYGSILIKLAEKDITVSVPEGLEYYGLTGEQVIENYTLTFDSKGGTAVSPITVEEGGVVGKPAKPTKSGFTFDGWFTSPDNGVTLDAASFDFTSSITADLTLYAKWTALPIVNHIITASAGAGGSITPSGAVSLAEGTGQSFTITPDSRYSISSVTVDGVNIGTVSNYTFSGVKSSHTIAAAFSYHGGSGGGNSGSGSSSGSSAYSPKPAAPKGPTKGETAIAPTVNGNGGAAVSVTTEAVSEAIQKARDEAKKNGTAENGISVEINVTTDETVSSITTFIPKEVQDQLINGNVSGLTIQSNDITIGFNKEALNAIRTTADSDVYLTAAPADVTKLPAKAQNAIGGRPLYDLSLTYGGQSMNVFGSGSVFISMPYRLQAGEHAANICAVYVGDDGGVTYIDHSSYDAGSQSVQFTTTHFSSYGVAGREAAAKPDRIMNLWAKAIFEVVQVIEGAAKQ